jgi:hypothetical protein
MATRGTPSTASAVLILSLIAAHHSARAPIRISSWWIENLQSRILGAIAQVHLAEFLGLDSVAFPDLQSDLPRSMIPRAAALEQRTAAAEIPPEYVVINRISAAIEIERIEDSRVKIGT